MARIIRTEELLLSSAEALSLIKNADGKVRFSIKVSAFLPTGDDKGFEGMSFLTISRADALKCVADMMRTFEDRGAKLRVHTRAEELDCFGKPGLSFISIY